MNTATSCETASKSSSSKPRLTAESVLEIFSLRPVRPAGDHAVFVPSSELSHKIARHFGVCDRTIRDIWNRRSWACTTRPFWNFPPTNPAAHNPTSGNTSIAPTLISGAHGVQDTGERSVGDSSSITYSTEQDLAQVPTPAACTAGNDTLELQTADATEQDEEMSTRVAEASRKGLALEAEIFAQLARTSESAFYDPFA